MTIPNLITLSGMAAVGFYVIGYLTNLFFLAVIMFFWAAISDVLDGILARRLRQTSKIGTVIDPLRDRLLMLAGFGNLIFLKGFDFILIRWISITIGIELLRGFLTLLGSLMKLRVETHPLGKIRHLGHCLLLITALGKGYGFLKTEVSIEVFVQSMAFLSLLALIAYLRQAYRTPRHL